MRNPVVLGAAPAARRPAGAREERTREAAGRGNCGDGRGRTSGPDTPAVIAQ